MTEPVIIITTKAQLAEALSELLPHHGPKMVPIKQCAVPYRIALSAVKDGRLRAFKVGRATFVSTDDVDAFIARSEHRVKAAAEPESGPDEVDELIAISRGGRKG